MVKEQALQASAGECFFPGARSSESSSRLPWPSLISPLSSIRVALRGRFGLHPGVRSVILKCGGGDGLSCVYDGDEGEVDGIRRVVQGEVSQLV